MNLKLVGLIKVRINLAGIPNLAQFVFHLSANNPWKRMNANYIYFFSDGMTAG